jgi:NAD(P)-dependent dehydrogenase (short-subunit alcohol dehydrogenase family)
MDVEGKRALITGGSSGIGLATAAALIAKGAKVFVTGRRPSGVAEAVEQLRSGGGFVDGCAADVTTEEGRSLTMRSSISALGGLGILINNAGGVRAGSLEDISEADISAMIAVDLLAPIFLTRAALPALRSSGDAMIVNVTSGIALVGIPFYAAYAAAKAGLARFGEAMRRELIGEGIHVLTVYPTATDTPMLRTSRAGTELGFVKEPVAAVANAIIGGIEADALEVVRGGASRNSMIESNRQDPTSIDLRFAQMKTELHAAVRDHSAL